MSGAAEPVRPTIHAIVRFVSQLTALTPAEITGRSRQRMYIRARMVVAHFACREGYTLNQIGLVMGGRDHSTICNLRDKAIAWRGKDRLFDRVMERMENAMERGEVHVPMVKFTPSGKPQPLQPGVKYELDDDYELTAVVPPYRAKFDPMLAALSMAHPERVAA